MTSPLFSNDILEMVAARLTSMHDYDRLCETLNTRIIPHGLPRYLRCGKQVNFEGLKERHMMMKANLLFVIGELGKQGCSWARYKKVDSIMACDPKIGSCNAIRYIMMHLRVCMDILVSRHNAFDYKIMYHFNVEQEYINKIRNTVSMWYIDTYFRHVVVIEMLKKYVINPRSLDNCFRYLSRIEKEIQAPDIYTKQIVCQRKLQSKKALNEILYLITSDQEYHALYSRIFR
jgi:hypothetical protein